MYAYVLELFSARLIDKGDLGAKNYENLSGAKDMVLEKLWCNLRRWQPQS